MNVGHDTSAQIHTWTTAGVNARTYAMVSGQLQCIKAGSALVKKILVSHVDNWESRDEEKAMAPHSSTFAWKIPWMEEPGGLQSRGT